MKTSNGVGEGMALYEIAQINNKYRKNSQKM